MSDQNLIEALEIGLYEDYLEKLEKKYLETSIIFPNLSFMTEIDYTPSYFN